MVQVGYITQYQSLRNLYGHRCVNYIETSTMWYYGGREDHSKYGCTSQTLYPALRKTGLRILGSMANTYFRMLLVSGFCNNGLQSPGLTVSDNSRLQASTYEQIISLWTWLNPAVSPAHYCNICKFISLESSIVQSGVWDFKVSRSGVRCCWMQSPESALPINPGLRCLLLQNPEIGMYTSAGINPGIQSCRKRGTESGMCARTWSVLLGHHRSTLLVKFPPPEGSVITDSRVQD